MATIDHELPVIDCCVPIAGPRVTDDEAGAIAGVFRALSDPHRVRIFNMIASAAEPVCVCDITDRIDLAQPTVSHHLKKLATAGLLERTQRGVWAYYSVRDGAMDRLRGVLG